ncbi:hypothetical protein P8452_54957 [Trifolium repens]|nr:hypothetical protein P8452_54957 [Trifolium repens]
MGNTEFKKMGFGAKWVWVVVPLIAVIVAIAVSSKTSSKISLFGVIGKACQCTWVFKLTSVFRSMHTWCCGVLHLFNLELWNSESQCIV